MRKISITIVLFCFAIALQSSAQARQNSDSLDAYFPLNIGDCWAYNYEESGVTPGAPRVFFQVVDTLSLDGAAYYAFQEHPNYIEYYRADSSGHVYRYLEDHEVLWYDLSSAAGDSYFISMPTNMVYLVKGLGRDFTIKNHAGEFTDCIGLLFDEPGSSDSHTYIYFAKKVGIVKRFLPHAIGVQLYSATVAGQVYPDTVTSIATNRRLGHPNQIDLLPNYPNPFNSTTTISYELPNPGFITVKVYDLTGRLVKVLLNGSQAAGAQRVTWNGMDFNGNSVAAGIYIYQIDFTDSDGKKMVQSKKMCFVK